MNGNEIYMKYANALQLFRFSTLFQRIYQFCTCIYLPSCYYSVSLHVNINSVWEKVFGSFVNYCGSIVEAL